jgi:adenine-specific DNA-methyltransferase
MQRIAVKLETEGVKYAGSKLKLLPHILQMIKKTGAKSVLDGFSGSTRVSQALARSGYKVIANDISEWSHVFARCYLLADRPHGFYKDLIGYLNGLKGCDGWYTENYGGDPDEEAAPADTPKKKPWQRKNTRRLDAIREEIDRLNLDETAKSVAITSLVLALDKVDSTLGHYSSYLRNWSPRSYKDMELKVPAIIQNGEIGHSVFKNDIFHILNDVEADLAYYDPPYGSNNDKMPPSRVRYASYYHLWTTICLNDRPSLFGKANRREDSSDPLVNSPFEDFRRAESGRFKAVEAIQNVLEGTKAKHILLSYSSGGRAASHELNDVIKKTGRLMETVEIDYRRNVMAAMRWTNDWTREAEGPNREFLFLIEK